MSRAPALVLRARGAVTPVGLTAEASCAALRAGISNKGEIGNFSVTGEGFDNQPVVGGRVPLEWLGGEPEPELWPGHERFEVDEPPLLESLIESGGKRLARLIGPALDDLRRDAGEPETWPAGTIAVLGVDADEEPDPVIAAVAEHAGLPRESVRVVRGGRAAGLAALTAASRELAAGTAPAALVGAVDSLIRPEVLRKLDRAGILPNADHGGVIPGEAAAFVLLEPAEASPATGAACRLRAIALADEPTADTDDPNRAEGLTRALREILTQAGAVQIPPLAICDLNGNRYRAVEWAMAWPRVLRFQDADLVFWHPADCLGDTGAASGIVNLVWGMESLRKGYARHREVLVWGASDGPLRAAALIDRQNGEG